MQKFNSSELSSDRRKVLDAADKAPVIIQVKRTNGDVAEEYKLERVKKGEGDE